MPYCCTATEKSIKLVPVQDSCSTTAMRLTLGAIGVSAFAVGLIALLSCPQMALLKSKLVKLGMVGSSGVAGVGLFTILGASYCCRKQRVVEKPLLFQFHNAPPVKLEDRRPISDPKDVIEATAKQPNSRAGLGGDIFRKIDEKIRALLSGYKLGYREPITGLQAIMVAVKNSSHKDETVEYSRKKGCSLAELTSADHSFAAEFDCLKVDSFQDVKFGVLIKTITNEVYIAYGNWSSNDNSFYLSVEHVVITPENRATVEFPDNYAFTRDEMAIFYDNY
jgi:hypothetical protein